MSVKPWHYGVAFVAFTIIGIFVFVSADKAEREAALNREIQEKIRKNDVKTVVIYGHTAYCIGSTPYVKTKDDKFYPASVRKGDDPCREK